MSDLQKAISRIIGSALTLIIAGGLIVPLYTVTGSLIQSVIMALLTGFTIVSVWIVYIKNSNNE